MKSTIFILVFLCAHFRVHAQLDFEQYNVTYDLTQVTAVDKKIGKTLRRHFIEGGGKEYLFSRGVVQDLSAVLVRRKLLRAAKLTFIEQRDSVYWYSVRTYPTKYSLVVGRVNIGFIKNEKDKTIRIVGLEDLYDFNHKRGGRPFLFEMMTRGMNTIIYRNKGMPYRMYYVESEM